mgnify:CR=1 FL=1
MIVLDKKLPEVFANKFENKIGNNEEVFYSKDAERSDNQEYNENTKKALKNVNQKIKDIFNSPNYVYKADVILTLKDTTLNKRIIGRNSTHLITIDNELIPISDIVDIEVNQV